MRIYRCDGVVFNLDNVAMAERDASTSRWRVLFVGASEPMLLGWDASERFGMAVREAKEQQTGKRPASWR